MAARLYLVPIVGAGTKPDPRAPKYLADGSLKSQPPWWMLDYGFEPWALVAADLSPEDEAGLLGQKDTHAFSEKLDATLSADDATSLQAVLEAMPLPGGWVAAGMTWRTVARTIISILGFMQRLTALTEGTVFAGKGVTLDTTFGQLAADSKGKIPEAAADLGLSAAAITPNTTLRTAFKGLADQKASTQSTLGPLKI